MNDSLREKICQDNTGHHWIDQGFGRQRCMRCGLTDTYFARKADAQVEIARLSAELEQAKSIAATALSEGTRVATKLYVVQQELAASIRWRDCEAHGQVNSANQWGWPDCVRELRAELAAANAEVTRLNKWADGMTDIALKERATGEAYQRELRAELAASQERERVLREFVKAWDEWLSPSNYSTQAPRLFDELKRKRAALGEDGGNG